MTLAPVRMVPVILVVLVATIGCGSLRVPSAGEDAYDNEFVSSLDDYTTQTRWSILTLDGSRPLRTILPHLATSYLFGEYVRPFSATGGNRLYLFPNAEYAITSWCDVCEEDTLELGTWRFAEGVVVLEPTRSSEGKPDFQDLGFFRRSIGDFRKFRFLVTDESGHIGQSILATPETLETGPENDVNGLVRRVPYADWPEALRRLRAHFRE